MLLFSDPYEEFLIDYLITKLENGSNTKQALELYQEQIPQSSNLKKKLKNTIEDLESGKLKLEEIFYKYKIINSFQYGLIKHSTSTLDGLTLIKSLQNSNSSLLVKMVYPIFVPLIIIALTFYGLILYIAILQNEMLNMEKVTPLIGQFINLPPYFNYTFAYSGLFISILITLVILIGYIYGRLYKPAWIYKILKTQAYSDGRFLFQIVYEMLKVGIPLHNIAEILAKDYGQVGLRSFFNDLAKAIKSAQPIYTVFEKYNFPPLLTIDVKISELNKTSYLNIASTLHKTCTTMYEKSIEYIVIQWYLFFWLIAFSIVVVVGSDMINLLVSSFTFKLLYS